MKNCYEEQFIISNELDKIQSQDINCFIEKISMSQDKYVTQFYNLSGDTLLIIPMPTNENYATIKDFIDNSPMIQQINFWKAVAHNIEEMLKFNKKIFISTHGLGVSYFHLRICTKPKYYHSLLKNT